MVGVPLPFLAGVTEHLTEGWKEGVSVAHCVGYSAAQLGTSRRRSRGPGHSISGIRKQEELDALSCLCSLGLRAQGAVHLGCVSPH